LAHPPAYEAGFESRCSQVVVRTVPFFQWVGHLKAKSVYYNKLAAKAQRKKDAQAATVGDVDADVDAEPRIVDDHPKPFDAFFEAVPAPQDKWHSPPAPWDEDGQSARRFDWVTPEQSYQWRCFQQMVLELRSQDCRVLVLVCPFNTHMVKPESQAGYERWSAAAREWLEGQKVTWYAPPTLPSEEYADASHPLPEGYDRMALGLANSSVFQTFMKPLKLAAAERPRSTDGPLR